MMMKELYKKMSLTVFLLLMSASFVLAQERVVSGTVTDEEGVPIPGVNVLVKGTTTGTASDSDGKYSIQVPDNNSILVFSFIGYTTSEVAVGSQTTISPQMTPDVQTLNELVVTGYTSERKADIIGSVAVVNAKDLTTTPVANLSNQLQGRAAGVLVSGGGAPGEAAKVRIRGFTSFGKNDPLYVVDGVPTQDPSKINPNDIESLQILKDATAASIYGSRAASGVIIVTTKQGKAGQMQLSYDGYVGTSFIPEKTFPDLINTEEYVEYLNRSMVAGSTHSVFGPQGNLSIPDFMVVSKGNAVNFTSPFNAGAPQVDPSLYSVPTNDYSSIYTITPISRGTNWFKEVTQKGIIQSHQLGISGGTDKSSYNLGFNYFDQEGAFKYSGYTRYAVRANSSFKPLDFVRIGENLQILHESFMNAGTNGSSVRGEASAWAQSFRMVPYIPVHDVGGGWGGNGIQDSGNGTNPVAQLYRDKDDVRQNLKMLGNVFAEIYPIKNLTFRTSFGLEYGNFYTKDIVKRTYERAENVTSTGLNVNATQSYGWTWSNTLVYNKTFGEHAIKLLAGSEAIKYTQDGLATQNVNGFDFEDPIFINLNTDLASGFGVSSTQTTPTVLASYFGKVDYIYNDKYLVNATIRRDGYSGFASSQRYAVFPAFGVSWRLSEEDFMSNIDQISDFKIRAGWGQMGSQANVNPQNSFTLFGTHPGLGNYDITRNQSSLAVGYAPIFLGSTTTKWETSESKNIGVDLAFFNNKLEVNANYFVTDVKDLLVDLTRNGLESVSYGLPKVNRGKMQNKGFEIDVTTKGNITNDLRYNATLTFTRVKNKVVDIDGNPETFYSRSSSRLTDIIRTTPGQPMSSFYGYQRDGFFNTQEEVDALNQPDARIGSWKFKDQDGDGDIDGDDRVFIGSPQPKFVMGINLGLAWKNFDFNTFLVWNYGNDLFNYTKYFTEMRGFVGGVSRNVLRNGWTPENHNADLPYLAPGGQSGYSSFIVSSASDYYVEKGSFLRGRTLQLGYTLPASLSSKAKISRARIYFQAQNYFTITDYTGADPDISIQGGDINSGSADLFMGVDETSTPTPRQFLLGLNLTF